MSFRCDACDEVVDRGIPEERRISAIRLKTYENEGRFSEGWEIASEERLCPPCAIVWDERVEKEKESALKKMAARPRVSPAPSRLVHAV